MRNDVPVDGKFSGTTTDTSTTSLAAQGTFGRAKTPGRPSLPAAARNAPSGTSNNLGTVAGRLGPIGAMALGILEGSSVFSQDRPFRSYSGSCGSFDFAE